MASVKNKLPYDGQLIYCDAIPTDTIVKYCTVLSSGLHLLNYHDGTLEHWLEVEEFNWRPIHG